MHIVLLMAFDPVGTVIFAAVVVAGCWVIWFFIKENKRKQQFKADYETALQGTSRLVALEAGRTYYRSLRGGYLTQIDETQIMNDITARQHLL